MSGKARLGKWVLLAIVVVMAVSELALAWLSLRDDHFDGYVFGRAILINWLLWQVWTGAGWARWLLAGLFLIPGAFGLVVGVSSAIEGRPGGLVTAIVGSNAVLLAFGAGLVSPWVKAYQAARRGSPAAPDQPAP